MKSASKLVEGVEVEGTWDIMLVVEGLGLDANRDKIDSEARAHSQMARPYFLSSEQHYATRFQSLSFSFNHHFVYLLVPFYNPYSKIGL